jgi:hypothetical protein
MVGETTSRNWKPSMTHVAGRAVAQRGQEVGGGEDGVLALPGAGAVGRARPLLPWIVDRELRTEGAARGALSSR